MIFSTIRRIIAERLRRRLGFPLQELALERLRQTGFQPHLLLDVGASSGLFADEAWTYWPEMAVHCFEPDAECVQVLQDRARRDPRLTVTRTLVGAREVSSQSYFYQLGGSTLFKEHSSADPQVPATAIGPVRSCRMITLDGYCQERRISPDFLKIDVQGYELEVLRGAERILPGIEVILSEVNHIDVYEGVPLAAELIAWLAQHGYALHDVCNFMRRPLDSALWQSDMIFVKQTSPLRASKTWK
ncbi:MAG: FkbM family methyltransferase [Elusimicrobiota bacterium]|jgi:FkbM family methyltransferase